jgi:hypothetical protein
MKKIKITLLLLIISFAATAQKPLIINYEEAVAKAKAELDVSMKSGELKEFAVKNNMKGEYIFDITIHERGKVLSVFAVSNDTDNIKGQNILKDFVRTLSFNFKLPKGKNYKFQYSFQF